MKKYFSTALLFSSVVFFSGCHKDWDDGRSRAKEIIAFVLRADTPPSQEVDVAAQREALIAIYENNPGNTLGWDTTDQDISTWKGVTVDANGKVVELILGYYSDGDEEIGYQLTSIPAEIGNLTSLTGLNLSFNQLESIPEEIGNLTSLTLLNLFGNQLTSIPTEIGKLTVLENLDLGQNQLTGIPEEIENLANLTVLNLFGNQLTVIPKEIGNLTSLTLLFLTGNQLTVIPQSLCELEDGGTTIVKDIAVVCE